MSEHIVHTAVLEDSFAICQGLPAITEDFREVMRHHGSFARLGSITVAGDTYSFRLLEEYKRRWDHRDDALKARLAFVLGWISHRACDRTMKPIWVEPPMKVGSDVNPAISPSECSVYHEGFMFNQYYRNVPAFSQCLFHEQLAELPGIGGIDLERAGIFTQHCFGAGYMDIQTLPAEGEDQKWFEEFCMRAQKFYVDMERYRKSAGSPDENLVNEYLTAINWYDREDAIVGLAAALRDGITPPATVFEQALAEEPVSYYGIALRLSVGYIITAALFFHQAEMGIAELKERLDIGKPGPGGQGV